MEILLHFPKNCDLVDMYYKEIDRHIERGWSIVRQHESDDRIFTTLETQVQKEIDKYSVDFFEDPML